MSTRQEHDETLRRFEEAMELERAKMRKFLMDKSKEERFRIMREDLSPKAIEMLCEWALPEEDYEICATVEQVKANNIAEFKIRFIYEGRNDNKAHIVKFQGEDGVTYYHADYILHDEDENSLVMLKQLSDGTWLSDWKSSDERLFKPIGDAIASWAATGATGNDCEIAG